MTKMYNRFNIENETQAKFVLLKCKITNKSLLNTYVHMEIETERYKLAFAPFPEAKYVRGVWVTTIGCQVVLAQQLFLVS